MGLSYTFMILHLVESKTLNKNSKKGYTGRKKLPERSLYDCQEPERRPETFNKKPELREKIRTEYVKQLTSSRNLLFHF